MKDVSEGLFGALRTHHCVCQDLYVRNDDLTPEEGFNELREVFVSDFAVIAKEYAEEREKVYGSEALVQGETAADYMEGRNSEEKEERDQYTTKEVNFDFEEYVMKFSRPEVLNWYSILFADYERNPEDVHECVWKMMHRIAFDHSQPSRLHHVSPNDNFCISRFPLQERLPG